MSLKQTLHLVAGELFRAYEDKIDGNDQQAVDRLVLIHADISNFLKTYNQPKAVDRRYFTPTEMPPGYDTVVGFLAVWHPEMLEGMDDLAMDTMQLGLKAARLCKAKGIKPIKVEAPEALGDDRHIISVNAYPHAILHEVIN